MKSLKIMLMLCAVCLMWTGCQDNEEPVNRVPSVTTGEAKPSSREATLYGTWNSLFDNPNRRDLYFLYSTNPDLSDAQEVQVNNKEYPNCWANIYKLQPNTTYYYALVCYADRNVDNPVSVRGEIKSFTTSEGVDVLKTYEADVNSTYSAVLYGLYKGDLVNPSFHFKVSPVEDMTDAFMVDAEPIDEFVDGAQVYRAIAYNLQPNTTYYYAFCVRSNTNETVAEVLKFTTKSSLYINRVTLTDWDGKVVDFPMEQFGCTFNSPSGSTYLNMPITRSGDKWKMEKDLIAEEGMWMANAYAPYTTHKENFISFQNYKYAPDSYQDNLLLKAEYETGNNQVDLNFSYYNSRVRFHFMMDRASRSDFFEATQLSIWNANNTAQDQKVFSTMLNYSLEDGSIQYPENGFKFNLAFAKYFKIDRLSDVTTDVVIYPFPTTSKGNVDLRVVINTTVFETFTVDWKAGQTYDYNVIISDVNGFLSMTIEDVTKY